MDAKTKLIMDTVLKLIAEPLGAQERELRALRRELDHAKREITLMKIRSGQRALVRSVRHE